MALLGMDVPVLELPGHSILIRPREPLPAHAVFAEVYAPGVTGTPELFVRPNGHVSVAGENEGAPLPEGTKDVEIDSGAIDKLVKASAAISESLAAGTVEVEQVGFYGG
ncbi:hypothetical protein K439DRAFT_1634785 [Ramaria rubella]|nr:hypothetical protein K439DRAFT_1634785 [Ramaria rubella]